MANPSTYTLTWSKRGCTCKKRKPHTHAWIHKIPLNEHRRLLDDQFSYDQEDQKMEEHLAVVMSRRVKRYMRLEGRPFGEALESGFDPTDVLRPQNAKALNRALRGTGRFGP